MVHKEGRIDNEEVFKAICNGYIFDLSEHKNEKGETNIIDI